MGITICSGGTGAPKAGLSIAATVGSGRLAQLLVGAGLSELSAWLPLVYAIPVVYSALCGTDPPTMTALTSAESAALSNNEIGPDFFSGLGKFKDVLLNLLWLDACECSGGALVVTSPPAAPSDTPFYVPPQPVSATACLVIGPFSFSLPGPGTITPLASGVKLPPGCTSAWLRSTFTGSSPTHADILVQHAANPVFNPADALSQTWAPGGVFNPLALVFSSGVPAQPLPSTNDTIWLTTQGTPDTTTGGTAALEFYCGGQVPGGPGPQPCCPPDITTQAYLDQILGMVTLIQRQAVPFGYVSGTVHTGLSGAGTLSIGGLLGVRIDVTTLPPHFGSQGTSPTEHFDLGWVTFGTLDGFPSAYRLERNPQIVTPRLCGAYTAFDYDLAPGIVVTVTELLREP